MNAIVERKAEELKTLISDEGLQEMTRDLRISDLMREGCKVSDQAYGWSTEQGNMCAWSAAAAAGIARGYLPE